MKTIVIPKKYSFELIRSLLKKTGGKLFRTRGQWVILNEVEK